jgi:hypothetical protein
MTTLASACTYSAGRCGLKVRHSFIVQGEAQLPRLHRHLRSPKAAITLDCAATPHNQRLSHYPQAVASFQARLRDQPHHDSL